MLGAEDSSWLSGFMESLVNTLSLEMLLIIFGGVMLGLILINIISLIWSYESRSLRAIKRINKYLVRHPAINDSNLVEFNSKMKKLPMRIRERWQLFMLERVGSPSRYLSVEYCVKRPLYNSAILQSHNLFIFVTIILSALSLIIGVTLANSSEVVLSTASVLSTSLIVPVVIIIVGCLYIMALNARYKALNRDFYDIFAIFVRNVDKASNTMPDYVDYELLFTKKEINRGIPVLREYLEKKALEEQRLLEKAKRDEVEHSPYNFEDLGINGAQLITRAIDESEEFLLRKLNLQEEITNLEKQFNATEQNMDDMEREANKKLQAIKENLERLDAAIQETTNRVEINYNRRQAKEEMDKKLLIEKDLKSMLDKERVAQDAIRVEIEKRKEEIDNSKSGVEFALKAEYNTFATRVYDEIFQKVSQDTAEIMHDYENQIGRLKSKLREFDKLIERKDIDIQAKIMEIENLQVDNSNLRAKLDKKAHKRHHHDFMPEDTFDQPIPQEETNLISASSGLVEGNTASDYHQLYDENGHMMNFTESDITPQEQSQLEAEDNEQSLITMPKDIVITPITPDTEEFQNFVAEPEVQEQPEPITAPEPVQEPVFAEPDALEEITPQEEVAIILPEEDVDSTQTEEQPQTIEKISVDWKNEDTAKDVNEFVDLNAEPIVEEKNKEKPQPVEEIKEEPKEEKPKVEQKKPATKKSTIKSSAVKKMKDKKDEKSSTTKKASTKKSSSTKKKEDNTQELMDIQKQIAEENKKLQKQQQELRSQIDETLNVIDTKANTKAEKQKRIKEIKDLIDKLRDEAKEAKARGASKTELNKINKNIAELLKTIADYQINN